MNIRFVFYFVLFLLFFYYYFPPCFGKPMRPKTSDNLFYSSKREKQGSLPLLICTWFLKNWVWKIKLDKLDFWSISNLNFSGTQALKIKLVQLDFSNSIFSKIKCRSKGDLADKRQIIKCMIRQCWPWRPKKGQMVLRLRRKSGPRLLNCISLFC